MPKTGSGQISRKERLSACPHMQAKDAKIDFDKKSEGWGLCDLGARKFPKSFRSPQPASEDRRWFGPLASAVQITPSLRRAPARIITANPVIFKIEVRPLRNRSIPSPAAVQDPK
jgi:hypothetical protein